MEGERRGRGLNHSALLLSSACFADVLPSTMALTTPSARPKSAKRMCGMRSRVQYAARSFSPSGFSFTNRTSACRAADMSGGLSVSGERCRRTESGKGSVGDEMGGVARDDSSRKRVDSPETPSPKKKMSGGLGRSRYGRIAWLLSWPNPLNS